MAYEVGLKTGAIQSLGKLSPRGRGCVKLRDSKDSYRVWAGRCKIIYQIHEAEKRVTIYAITQA